MITLIKAEIRKMLFRKGVLISWIISLLLGTVLIHNGTVSEVYADTFFKSYGYTPIIGLLMFMILSGSYTIEYDSNMKDLINSTKNGKKKLVIAKAIGAGIAASIVNVSIVIIIYLDAVRKAGPEGLYMPLKDLWYFSETNSDLNVLQMMIIVIISVIIGSFFFAQLGLYLSSRSKSATMPFIVGGLIMGTPYILQGFIPAEINIFTPLSGMMSSEIIRNNGGPSVYLFQGIVLIVGGITFYKLSYNRFINEN
ncbi:MAG TPA: hypothetical protein VK087_07590 [Tissierellaceae bacterium]|nr:hypothetical protein [Tissierellaceae bacterium]